MDTALTWLTIAGLALITYANRSAFLLLAGRLELPHTLRRALRYVPPAVLTALIVPALLLPAGELDLSLANDKLVAGIVAGLVAWKWHDVLLTIVAGMATLHLLRYAAGLA